MTINPPVPVLYIAGWGRCGSTLLDMMLGEVPGVFSAGEVRELWLRGCVENRPCGCGERFHACPFWTKVGDVAFGGWAAVDLDDLLRVRYSADRAWYVPRLLARGHHPGLARYRDALTRLYGAIRDVSGADLVVDSSKMASHALLLHGATGVELRVVHLVRDSRGVAYSVQKRVEKPVDDSTSTLLPRHGPVTASGRYLLYNGLAAGLRSTGIPFTRVRYEDLVDDPGSSLARILDFAGRPPSRLPFVDGRMATLSANHMVDGNPARFRTGTVALRRDDEWRTKLPANHRRLVTGLTYPLLTAYHYVG
jgi:hypothetical protein